MNANQTIMPTIKIGSDDSQNLSTQKSPTAVEIEGFKAAKDIRRDLPSKDTPIRQPLLNAPLGSSTRSSSSSTRSSLSSTRSSSSCPSTFDDNASPAGTPLTPPSESNQTIYPKRGSFNSKKPRRPLFQKTPPIESPCFNSDPSSPSAQSPRGRPPRSSTPDMGKQSPEQNDASLLLSQSEGSDSPTAKAHGRKLERETAPTGRTSCRRSKTTNRAAEGSNTLKGALAQTLNHYTGARGGDEKETPPPDTETEVAKNTPRLPTPTITGSEEAHEQRPSSPSTILVSVPPEQLSTTRSSSRLRSRSERQTQPSNNIGSSSVPSPPSSSKPRKRTPRKSTSSPPKSEKVEPRAIDSTKISRPPPINDSIAEPEKQTPDCDINSTARINQNKDTSTGQVTKFDHANEEGRALGNALNLEILHTIRRESREKKLKENLLTALFVLVFFPIIPNKMSSKVLDIDEGFIYIFKSNAYPGYVKIGKTKQEPEKRISQWKKQCKLPFTCIHVLDPNDKSFRHYGIVEELVQAELWNERRKFKCKGCGKGHQFSQQGDATEDESEQEMTNATEDEPQQVNRRGRKPKPKQEKKSPKKNQLEQEKKTLREHKEWFEITEERALEVVEKWRSWIIKCHPYTRRGVLTPFWKWKYQQAMKSGEIDWVKWRSPGWLERLPYAWYCIRTMAEEDLFFVLAFTLFFTASLGLLNLFVPINVSGAVVSEISFALPFSFICYKRIYW